MTTRICLNYKNPKKDDSGGVVPDYEPSGVEELRPFLDGQTYGGTSTMILRHGDMVNPILDLDKQPVPYPEV